MSIRDRICEHLGEDIMFLEPAAYDEAIIGLAERAGGLVAVAYDRDKVVEILCRDMPEQEAEEFYGFNIADAWIGEATPVFIDTVYTKQSN
jgi:hypothetical protein